ncbi:hypothetical protein [Kribbella jiaozuonensis]|nr:hypothetical protein [Kribbella jiaozuonensis]
MFQYFSEQTDMFARDFSIEQTRTLNPALQSFSTWLATNKDRIPVH